MLLCDSDNYEPNIDVREPVEYAQDHVESAINIPSASLLIGAPELASTPKETELIVYCKIGTRSALAALLFRSKGFRRVTNGINKEQVRAALLSGSKLVNELD